MISSRWVMTQTCYKATKISIKMKSLNIIKELLAARNNIGLKI